MPKPKPKAAPPRAPASTRGLRRAIIYIRVSTSEQEKYGTSLEKQREKCIAYALEHSFSVVAEVFQDDYSGATPIESRPAGARAYAMLKDGLADTLIAFSVDRIVRPPEEGDEFDTAIMIRNLARIGCEIHTVEDGHIASDFSGLLMAVLKARSAGEERRKIMGRSLDGRQRKAARGQWVGQGPAPWGWRRTGRGRDAALQIDDTAAVFYRRMFTDCRAGVALNEIARQLTADEVPTPRGGRGWYRSYILDLLRSRRAIGEFTHGEQIVRLPELAIVDAATFEAVQEILDEQARVSQRNRSHDYLLSGYIQCQCGRSMCGRAENRARRAAKGAKPDLYYRCTQSYSDRHMATCRTPCVRADRIEPVVWAWLGALVRDEGELRVRLAEAQAKHQSTQATERERLAEMTRGIERADRRMAQLLATLPDNAPASALAALRAELDREGRQRDALAAERDALARRIEAGSITDADTARVLAMASAIRAGLAPGAEPSYEFRRDVCAAFRLSVVVRWDADGREEYDCCVWFLPEREIVTPIAQPGSITRPRNRCNRVQALIAIGAVPLFQAALRPERERV